MELVWSGGRARRHAERRLAGAEVELDPFAVVLEPNRVAGARDEPRRRDVIALRDAAHLEQLRWAVGARVAAVGPKANDAPRLVEPRVVAGAKTREALAEQGLPARPEPQGLALG